MRRLLTLCGVTALAACNHLDAPEPDFTLPTTETNVVGTFVLQSANGRVPPYVTQSNSAGTKILLNDRIVLHDDLTWADTTNYELDLATGETQFGPTSTAGTYNIGGGHINFTMTTGGNITFVGSVVGNTLTVLSQNRPFVYGR